MSSKRRLRRRACTNKVRHETQDNARIAIFKMKQVGSLQSFIEPYRCKHCGGWHLGHPKGSRNVRPMQPLNGAGR